MLREQEVGGSNPPAPTTLKEAELKKILIFQTAFLGDLILTSPLIKSVKKSFPESEVSLIVRKGFESVFKGFPYVSEIIPYNKKKILEFSKILKGKNFDLVISPHRSHRTSLVLFLSGVKRRIGFNTSGFSFLYTDRVKYRQGKGIHEVDRNLDLLLPLKDEFSIVIDREPELPISDIESKSVLEKFNLKKGYITLAPGSVWKTKMWLPEYYGDVARYFLGKGKTVVLVGSKGDIEACQKVHEIAEKRTINLCGKTTLREFFSVIRESELLISNDSSPVHVATSFKIPVVAIFGATVPEFGFYPYRNGVVAEVENLYCRPCGIHGGKKCPEGHFRCMRDLKPEIVIEKAKFFSN